MKRQIVDIPTPVDSIGFLTLTIALGTEGLEDLVTVSVGPDTTIVYPTPGLSASSLATDDPWETVYETVYETVTKTVDRADSSDASSQTLRISTRPTSGGFATVSDSSSSSLNDVAVNTQNIGAIIGGVMGGLTIIGIVVVVVYWIRLRHSSNKSVKSANTYNGERDSTPHEVTGTRHELPSAQTAPELADTVVLQNRLPTS